MYCFLYTTNSLFLKLFLKVGLQCNFLLFLKFETGSLASETENVKLFRPHSGAEMGQWVKLPFSLAVYISGCELRTFIPYGDKISQHYMFGCKNCYNGCISSELPTHRARRRLSTSTDNMLLFSNE